MSLEVGRNFFLAVFEKSGWDSGEIEGMREKLSDGESSGAGPPSSGLVELVPLTSAVPKSLCCRIFYTTDAMVRIFVSENFGGSPRLRDFLQNLLPPKNSSAKLSI